MTFGDVALSIETSLNERWVAGSYLFSSSTVVSPSLQKEKKVTNDAAHSITDWNDWSLSNHTTLIFLKITGVIGNRDRGAFPALPLSTFTPLKT